MSDGLEQFDPELDPIIERIAATTAFAGHDLSQASEIQLKFVNFGIYLLLVKHLGEAEAQRHADALLERLIHHHRVIAASKQGGAA